MNEIWKDIVGYEGFYQVSNFGRVKSLRRKRIGESSGMISEKILKAAFRHGYRYVLLSKDTKKKTHAIHRLVAIAFIPAIEGKNSVNHIDGNKLNNRDENLEWCTHAENIAHSLQTGLRKKKKLICTKTGKIYTFVEAAASINRSIYYLYNMIKGRQTNCTSFKLLEQ